MMPPPPSLDIQSERIFKVDINQGFYVYKA